MCDIPLEKEVAVVNHSRAEDEVLHEVAHVLHSTLAAHLNLLLLVVLGRTHLLLHYLEDIDASVALDRGGAELALSRGSHGTREGGLSSSRGLDEGRGCKRDLIDRADLGTLGLGSSDAVDALELGHDHLGLLVADHLALENLLHLGVVPRTVALRMDLGHAEHQQVVVLLASLEELGNLSLLGLEDPLDGVADAGTTDVAHRMAGGGEVVEILDRVAKLRGVLLQVGQAGLALRDKLAETVVSLGVGIVGETDFLLDDGSDGLALHRLAVEHLDDDVALGELDVLGGTDGTVEQRLDVGTVVLAHRAGLLIHRTREPRRGAVLAVALGDGLEVATSGEGLLDAVGRSASGLQRLATHLDLTELHGVGGARCERGCGRYCRCCPSCSPRRRSYRRPWSRSWRRCRGTAGKPCR